MEEDNNQSITDMRFEIVNIKTGKVVEHAKTYRTICERYANLEVKELRAGREVRETYKIKNNLLAR